MAEGERIVWAGDKTVWITRYALGNDRNDLLRRDDGFLMLFSTANEANLYRQRMRNDFAYRRIAEVHCEVDCLILRKKGSIPG